MTWSDWGAAFVMNNPTLLDVPPADDVLRWREWAIRLRDNPRLGAYVMPEPAGYESWEEWAEALSGTLVAGL